MKVHQPYLSIFALLVFFALPSHAEDQIKRFEAADSEGVTATRDSTTLYLQVDAAVKGPITIPRLAAPLRSMSWEGIKDDSGLTLKPGLDTWQVSWKKRPEGATELVLRFDAPPLLMDAVSPVEETGDGSLFLPAHLAVTSGEKIRYEPQPYKNTVGFWAGKEDKASWMIRLKKGGRYNVAVLQGCGKGQGGSLASLRVTEVGREAPHAELSFEVKETGHWQNFQWRQLGEIELAGVGGDFWLDVMPKQIKKAALMDIRAIHLIRLPDKK